MPDFYGTSTEFFRGGLYFTQAHDMCCLFSPDISLPRVMSEDQDYISAPFLRSDFL
jgi:hypothetical protein